MTKEKFDELVDYMIEKSGKTLKEKNAKYAPENDALHNFHYGAQMDNSTTAQTIWHYWKKHMVALMDKINRDDWKDLADAEEKIQDSINYLLFIWCAANEANGINSSEDDWNWETKEEYMSRRCNGCELECLVHEASCNCCKTFDEMMEAQDEELPPRCSICNHNFIRGTKEYAEHRSQFVFNEELNNE